MHSSRDQNFASLHAHSSLPGHVLDVVALTTDAGLLATLRDASGPEHAIWHAQSADVAVDLLVGGRCGILIADLGALRGDAPALLERLQAQFPELVLMTTGRRAEEGAVASLVSKGLVYRFLHKPVSPARAGLFLSAATRRYYELRNAEPLGMATVKTIAAKPHMGKMVAVAIAVVAGIAGFIGWRSIDKPAPVAVEHSQRDAPTSSEQATDLLARAEIALASGRLVEPRGDNALNYFNAVLALQPDHEAASAGVTRVAALLEARVAAALQARNASAGATALIALQRAQPSHPRLDALRAELIVVSRGAALREPAAPTVPVIPGSTLKERVTDETPASTLTALVEPAEFAETAPSAVAPADEPVPEADAESVSTESAPEGDDGAIIEAAPENAVQPTLSASELQRVVQLRERGALIAPVGENAYEVLLELSSSWPEADEIRGERQRLAFALLDHARTALAADDLENAGALLSRTDSLVPGMSSTQALQQQLAAAQAKRDFTSNIVQAAALRRVREASPEYPFEARRAGLEGWVDVEFTIAPDGATRDLVVRDAENREAFEKPALDSVRRWRFEPIMRNGEAVAQRAVLRVRFALK